MDKYDVVVDLFEDVGYDDSDDLTDIEVVSYVISAESPKKAREIAYEKASKDFPDKLIYVWEVLDDDIIKE